MTSERQEQLKSMLFDKKKDVAAYRKLPLEELIYLYRMTDGARLFLGAILEKLRTVDEIYITLSRYTKMPFVYCEPETFDDQIFVYTSEEAAKEGAARFAEEHAEMNVAKIRKEKFLNFYVGLYLIGVNAVVVDDGEQQISIQLGELVTRPDYSKLPEGRIVVENPQLQLTAIYFMQELRKQEKTKSMQELKAMEEEMMVNIHRGKYLVPIQDKNKVPFMKYDNGDIYQPIFTDAGEFTKFNRENNFQAVAMPFENLKKIVMDQSKGVVINPQGFHLVLTKAQLQ